MIKTLPMRICEHGNEMKGGNPLMDIIGSAISQHLGPINHLPNEVLDKLYVRERYYGGAKANKHAELRPGQYRPNRVERWESSSQQFFPIECSRHNLRQQIADEAQLAAANELLDMSDMMLSTRNSGVDGGILPVMQRLFFIMGGIGSGKTTMLAHFRRVTLSKLKAVESPSVQFFPIMVNMNDHSYSESIREVWLRILREFREGLRETSFDTAAGWEEISWADLVDKNGDFRPEIMFSPDPEKAKRHIISQCGDDRVFLKRVARTMIACNPPTILLLILDNIDRVSMEARQLRLIDRLSALLHDLSDSIGMISVRPNTVGTLAHLKGFSGYMHLRRLRLTAPRMGEIFQKRIDQIISSLDESTRPQEVKISDKTVVRVSDIRDIMKHINTSFTSTSSDLESYKSWTSVPSASIERFLPYAFHSNVRGALDFLASALSSWALQTVPVVTDYLYQRDRGLSVNLPPFTVDELLRLGAVGSYKYYDHQHGSGLFNVFCYRGMFPNRAAGRFPVLIIYRILQYLVKKEKIAKRDFFDVLRCFGCAQEELERILKMLFDGLFVESREGNDLKEIKIIEITKKAAYYYNNLCPMLCYLETVRNDAIIEYEAEPREIRDKLAKDLVQVGLFCKYILTQEEDEWGYIKEKGKSHVRRYKEIVVDDPAAARLYRSVVQRATDLVKLKEYLLPDDRARRVVERQFEELRAALINAGQRDMVWWPRRVHELPRLELPHGGK
jgi:hypothetical protein